MALPTLVSFLANASSGAYLNLPEKNYVVPKFELEKAEIYFPHVKVLQLLNAVLAGDIEKGRKLVQAGVDPNSLITEKSIYANNIRLLHYAIAAKNLKTIDTLLALGADPELNTKSPGSPLIFTLKLEYVDGLTQILRARPYSTLSRDTVKSLLFQSVTLPRTHCLAILLKQGFPIDFQNDAGYTIFMAALDVQDYELANWLLDQGANIIVDTPSGMTPAYSIQYHLQKFTVGSPTYIKVLHIKEKMEKKGAIFPALGPKEVRAMKQTTLDFPRIKRPVLSR